MREAVWNVKPQVFCETAFWVSIGLFQALQKYAQNTHDQTAVSYLMQGFSYLKCIKIMVSLYLPCSVPIWSIVFI